MVEGVFDIRYLPRGFERFLKQFVVVRGPVCLDREPRGCDGCLWARVLERVVRSKARAAAANPQHRAYLQFRGEYFTKTTTATASNRQYDAANETIDVIPGSQDDAATGTKCRVVALQLSGVPSGMSRIHRECHESDPSDRSVVADVPSTRAVPDASAPRLRAEAELPHPEHCSLLQIVVTAICA